ncbi:hybrid sensor histidine kinase/response regulator [Photobacterium kishitanii]|uniref:hybrid sensor histidine kinase/response regulator n=1 Tax=Photobacterium kishitanii TaxID=318456 RepID=UPI0004307CC1|nr:response regulator [Photobacterium kishitanii]CEO38710.1 LuxN, autoinducer 1 sensor kinase/phosphatase [Photobacterium kishitanii]
MPDLPLLLFSEPRGALLFFAAGIILAWLGYFSFTLFTSRPGANRNVYYPYLAYSVSIFLWILSNAYFQSPLLTYYSESTAVTMALFANLVSFCAFISAYSFSCRLISTQPDSNLSLYQKLFISIISLYALIINSSPGLTVKHVDIVAPGDFVIIFGPQTSWFFLCLMSAVFLTFHNFLIYKKAGSPLIQKKSQYMILGVIIFMLSTLIVHLIIPFMLDDFSLTWVPPALAIFETLLIGYALLFNRFYSPRYIISQFISHLVNVTLYLSPYLLIIAIGYEDNPLLIGLWIALIGLGWKSSLIQIKRGTNRLLYGKNGSPSENIQRVIGHFQYSTEYGLGKLNELLNTRSGQILNINTHSDLAALKIYFEGKHSVLVKDELEFQIQYETHTELSNISWLKKNMDANNSALVLPIVSKNGDISHLFMVSKKDRDGLFSSEEIDALQVLFEQANQYIRSEEQVRKSQVLAGSIAHEIRNPLSKIQYHFERIDADLFDVNNNSAHPFLSEQMKGLYKELTESKKAVQLGTRFIDIIIDEIKGNSINSQTFSSHSAGRLTEQALSEYGFVGNTYQARIIANTQNDFQFWGNETLFSFVMFNLVKNALHYFSQYPQSTLSIHLERGESENCIIVTDTGPGIADNVIPHIFDEFYTLGKSDGSGLGLAYCRRVINAFGGNIHCQSKYGSYTRFTLTFPIINEEHIPNNLFNELKEALTGKQVLVIGPKENTTLISSLLSGFNIIVSTVDNGKSAAKYIGNNNVDFAFYDLSLSPTQFEALKKIRSGDFGANAQKIPLIALSNENTRSTRFDTNVFQGEFRISDSLPLFAQSLKLLIDSGSLKPLGHLIGKRVLVVDDMQINRMLVQSYLAQEGITVLQAHNGSVALCIAEQERPDLILMDIHMPEMDGLEVTRILRQRGCNIPIIALSGECCNEVTKEISQYMNAHLMKPITRQQLMQKLQYWIPESEADKIISKQDIHIVHSI